MKRKSMKITAGILATATALAPLPAFGDTDIGATASESIAVETEDTGYSADSITLQPGETEAAVNLNWYAPKGTTEAAVRFTAQDGTEKTVSADVSALHAPTELKESKYKDSGKLACKATVSELDAGTEYTYAVSNDGGKTWSKSYTYRTPDSDSFKFAFTSDPQIKESGEQNGKKPADADGGWDPDPADNQTGWAKMMEVIGKSGATLVVSAGDQVEDQSWGKTSEYDAFFAPEEMSSIAYAPAVGNHDRHYMFADHFNMPNEMAVAEDGTAGGQDELTQVKISFRGQNGNGKNDMSLSHGNYTQATEDEIAKNAATNGVSPDGNGKYDYTERREMETEGNYYYLYNNVLFVTLNTGAYPGGNDDLDGENDPSVVVSANAENEASGIIENFRKTLSAATSEYSGKYDWIMVAHHKSTQTVAKHAADSDIENYVDAGFEKLMDDFNVDFVLGGHDHVYSRSYVLKDGKRVAERLNTYNDPDGTIYLTGNCCSDMQYYTPFQTVDKDDNADFPVLANGQKGSQAYMKGASASDDEKAGYLPYGNQEWNQEYSPSYALFDVEGDTISVKVYNLDGDSQDPSSKEIDSFRVTKNSDGGEKSKGFENSSASLKLTQAARYDSGMVNADGGVMEIVDYNKKTGWAYSVNGQSGKLTAIPMNTSKSKLDASGDKIRLLDGNDIDVKAIVNAAGYTYGDMTSVSISPDGKWLAAAVQAENYADNGLAVIFRCNDDGTLTFENAAEVGVQPDMITFTPDGTKILTANEGEPREGYSSGAEDPAGSVTIINITETADGLEVSPRNAGFEAWDSAEKRAELVSRGIVLKKDAAPSLDLEPEYIATTDKTAYITLQEANAVAELDIEKGEITNIYSVGFEDYSKTAVDIDKKDEKYAAKTYEDLLGIRMPDGISFYQSDGKTYLMTANEGDAREWGAKPDKYSNEDERNFGKERTSPTGKITPENSGLTGKVVFYDVSTADGLDSSKDYIFGGRSFTIFEVNESGLKEVYDSGNDFEAKTAVYLPEYFNCSNDDLTVDDRSGKKGPEPETVTTGQVGSRNYAFITLERTGGVMVYDITDSSNISYVNYINSRDLSSDTGADDSPEGLKFVPASASPTGNALLMAACEVGGTVAVYELEAKKSTTGGGSHSSSSGSGSASGSGNGTGSSVSGGSGNTAGNGAVSFKDVKEGSWMEKAVNFVAEKGLFNGTAPDTFSPEKEMTRAMLMTVLARLNGADTTGNALAKGVEWAIANGVSDGRDPGAKITREQIVTMLYRNAGKPQLSDAKAASDALAGFKDAGKVSSYALDAMKWAVANGIINGTGDNTIAPKAYATRAQTAQMLMNYETAITSASSAAENSAE